MKCPKCQVNRTHKIVRTYPHRSETRVYRIRQCVACKKRWRTFEQVDPRNVDAKRGRPAREGLPVGDAPPPVDVGDAMDGYEQGHGMGAPAKPELAGKLVAKAPHLKVELVARARPTGMSTQRVPANPSEEPDAPPTNHQPPPQSRSERQRMKDFAEQVKKEVDKLID